MASRQFGRSGVSWLGSLVKPKALRWCKSATPTEPRHDVLCALLARYAPCVVLLDELVVYIRQFVESQPLSGGTYNSNLSFIQSLTEAVKLVPSAVVLASLPDSNGRARRSTRPRGIVGARSDF